MSEANHAVMLRTLVIIIVGVVDRNLPRKSTKEDETVQDGHSIAIKKLTRQEQYFVMKAEGGPFGAGQKSPTSSQSYMNRALRHKLAYTYMENQ